MFKEIPPLEKSRECIEIVEDQKKSSSLHVVSPVTTFLFSSLKSFFSSYNVDFDPTNLTWRFLR